MEHRRLKKIAYSRVFNNNIKMTLHLISRPEFMVSGEAKFFYLGEFEIWNLRFSKLDGSPFQKVFPRVHAVRNG